MSLRKRLDEIGDREWSEPYQALKNDVHRRLVEELGRRGSTWTREEVEREVGRILDSGTELLTRGDRVRLIADIADEAMGYGPIESLVRDANITEIMVNGPNVVFAEQAGKIFPTAIRFRDDQHVMRIIEKIVSEVGRRIDEAQPYVDARLPDGSRVNAIIPPLSLNGPCLTIRKFARDPYVADDLIAFGTLTAEIADVLRATVQAKLNVVVTGGTGAGKTTLLNVLSMFIPATERIITIEDSAELQLKHEHWVRLETRPPNIEGRGQVTTRDLVRNALRMRPDRIIVGEVRGGEALDMLQALNTGHEGSLTTVHANAPRDGLSRIETMVMMAGLELPTRAIREQVAAAIHVIVHVGRYIDGVRRVSKVSEVTGMEGDIITMQDIAVFVQQGVDPDGRVRGRHEFTGIRPRFYDRLKPAGVDLPLSIFLR
ncbi:MAG TPA: CpaF family protein [bacterium]|nr:CpaF family protein [bacterium]